jgi:hypothetical protein
MDEPPGKLNQTFVKVPGWAGLIGKPQLLEDVMRFVIEARIETFKIGEIVSVVTPPSKRVNNPGNLLALLAHVITIPASHFGPKWIL